MNPRVNSVVARDDYKLEITFANGEVGLFDCGPLLDFGVFRESGKSPTSSSAQG